MKIIALEVENENIDSNKFNSYSKEEARQLWELYKNGVVREYYFRDDQSTAVLVLEVDDLEQARNELKKLPFVNNNLITFDLIPLKPYPGFERLFEKK